MKADEILRELRIVSAILGHDGKIMDVSKGWKLFASANQLWLPKYGVGLNYLDYCGSVDGSGNEIVTGLRNVLMRRATSFATFYLCNTPTQRRLYLLASFAPPNLRVGAAVLHLDVSHLLGADGVADLMTPLNRLIKNAVVDAIAHAVPPGLQDAFLEPVSLERRKALARMSDRQTQILKLLAVGASNKKIAADLALSLPTVKAQTASITRKLGLLNRAQTAIFAAQIYTRTP